MTEIKKYEEVEVWQISFEIFVSVYKLTNRKEFDKDLWLKEQIRSTSVSLSTRIAECFETEDQKLYKHYLHLSRGYCKELQTQFQIAENLKYIPLTEFEKLEEDCISVEKQLDEFINELKTNKNR